MLVTASWLGLGVEEEKPHVVTKFFSDPLVT